MLKGLSCLGLYLFALTASAENTAQREHLWNAHLHIKEAIAALERADRSDTGESRYRYKTNVAQRELEEVEQSISSYLTEPLPLSRSGLSTIKEDLHVKH